MFPARVGMIRTIAGSQGTRQNVPRACGDEPEKRAGRQNDFNQTEKTR